MQAHSHTHTHGGAAQLEVGSLPVSVSRPSALHCYLCLTHFSPGNVTNPTPGPLMSTPLVNIGQPTLYYYPYYYQPTLYMNHSVNQKAEQDAPLVYGV